MHNLGLSPSAVQSILQKHDWVKICRDELAQRLSGLIETDFPEGYFARSIKPQLDRALQQELTLDGTSIVDIRGTIQRWILISNFKAQLLIRLSSLIPNEFSVYNEIMEKYSGVPLGPQDSEVIDKMTEDELKWWHYGNIAIFFTSSSVTNILGLFVSELFFTLEAMARALCIASCLAFSIKSVLPMVTIQHDEIYKTLKRLGSKDRDKVTCRLCPIAESCICSQSYNQIALIYELFYHLRVIKDYRLDFYFEPELIPFLMADYIPQGFEVICTIDKVIHRVFLNYMVSPLSIADHKEKIYNIFNKIKI